MEKPHEENPLAATVSRREALLQVIQEDLGEFPFEALWPQRQEGSLIKILTIVNTIGIFVAIMIIAFK